MLEVIQAAYCDRTTKASYLCLESFGQFIITLTGHDTVQGHEGLVEDCVGRLIERTIDVYGSSVLICVVILDDTFN